jgi:hypothetical protein
MVRVWYQSDAGMMPNQMVPRLKFTPPTEIHLMCSQNRTTCPIHDVVADSECPGTAGSSKVRASARGGC